jgi:hypothetical protein
LATDFAVGISADWVAALAARGETLTVIDPADVAAGVSLWVTASAGRGADAAAGAEVTGAAAGSAACAARADWASGDETFGFGETVDWVCSAGLLNRLRRLATGEDFAGDAPA